MDMRAIYYLKNNQKHLVEMQLFEIISKVQLDIK
jgi:hypothetical protein